MPYEHEDMSLVKNAQKATGLSAARRNLMHALMWTDKTSNIHFGKKSDYFFNHT